MEFSSVLSGHGDVNESHLLAKRRLNGAATSGLIIGIIALLLGSWLIFSHLYVNKIWFRKKPTQSEGDLEMGNRSINARSLVQVAANSTAADGSYTRSSQSQLAATAIPVLTIQVPTPDASPASLSSTGPCRIRSPSLSLCDPLTEPEMMLIGEYSSACCPLARPTAALPVENLVLDACTTACRDSIISDDEIAPASTTHTSAGDATQEAGLSDTDSKQLLLPSPTRHLLAMLLDNRMSSRQSNCLQCLHDLGAQVLSPHCLG
jgi:hypothetical protein